MSKMNRKVRHRADIDDAQALARAEQIIDLLRTRYVCQDWKLDEEAAERMLQYFRKRAAGVSPHGRKWLDVVAFCRKYGQSLDWIVRGDPGGMICGAAALSVLAATLHLQTVGE